MKLELVVRPDERTREQLEAIEHALEWMRDNTARMAAALSSIDSYFKRLNRATEAHIVIGKISEQEAP